MAGPRTRSSWCRRKRRREVSGAVSGRGKPLREAWEALFARYRDAHPDLAQSFEDLKQGKLPGGWDDALPTFEPDAKGIASREASGKVLNAIAAKAPGLVGGAADLSPSTKTEVKDAPSLEANTPGGRNMHFGIREHAMGSIANGMALTYLRPYTGTFMVFSDYMRPPIRLAAIMDVPVVFVFTHDSIGVGEDGPTHQPIEAARRAPRDPWPRHDPPRRRQRGGGRLEGGAHPHARADRADLLPSGDPDAGTEADTPRPLGWRRVATCSPTPTASRRSS